MVFLVIAKQSEFTPERLLELRTVCKFCNRTFKLLGIHVWLAHQMLARDYKILIGLNMKDALTSDEVRAKHQAHVTGDQVARLLKHGIATRIPYQPALGKGHPRYVSSHHLEQLDKLRAARGDPMRLNVRQKISNTKRDCSRMAREQKSYYGA